MHQRERRREGKVEMDDGPPPSKKPRVPKVAKVKNKMPAEVQITAEQLLQEAAATKVS